VNGHTTRTTLTDPTAESHSGLAATRYVGHPKVTGPAPETITLDQLIAMTGNRLPVGFNPARNPGPFDTHWSRSATITAWAYDGHLLDATGRRTQIVTLTGGGLTSARTMSVAPAGGAAASSWSVGSSYVGAVGHASLTRANSAAERDFWRHAVPVGLLAAAAALVSAAWWSTRSPSSAASARAKVPARSAA
jgi:high-affinity iron transporter